MDTNLDVNLYIDESFLPVIGNKEWMLYGILINKKSIEMDFFNKLYNCRCLRKEGQEDYTNCQRNCRFHNENNTELHFQEIGSNNSKFKISKKWLNLIVNEEMYFYILGINLKGLDFSYFGDTKPHLNLYNRFLRTAIKRAIKHFFLNNGAYNNVNISNIYHDNTIAMEQHEYFKEKTIKDINLNEDNINCLTKEIEFINSNHKELSNINDIIPSHFIQLIDLILGVVGNSITNNAENSFKIELTDIAYPLIDRIIKQPFNHNSSYKYFRKKRIEFYPKEKIPYSKESDIDTKLNEENEFYSKEIELLFGKKDQYSLNF